MALIPPWTAAHVGERHTGFSPSLKRALFSSYAPWCPACQSLQPEWEKFAEWGEDLEVNIAKVDVTEEPGNPVMMCCTQRIQ